MVLHLVDRPNGALNVLHAHEALVEAKVVSDGILHGTNATKREGNTLNTLVALGKKFVDLGQSWPLASSHP